MGTEMATAIVMVALIGFVAFRQWLAHQRRMMMHRERVAAIEKGMELPPMEMEIRRTNFNVQRVLLLAGLCWISIGLGAMVVLSAVLTWGAPKFTDEIPAGLQFIGIAPIGIGIAHVIVFFVGKNKVS
jgi:hypothetical protein